MSEQNVWLTAATGPLVIPAGHYYDNDAVILVRPGTGDVQIQFQGPAGEADWYTPAGEGFTLAEDTVSVLPRANLPAVRVIATGTAAFKVRYLQ